MVLRFSLLSSLLLAMFLSISSGCGQPDPKKGPDFNEANYNDPLKAMEGMGPSATGKKGGRQR